jgi:uncharacterized RDD family membrane protein YckC
MNLLLQSKKLAWFLLIGLSLGMGAFHLEAQDATEDQKPEAEVAKDAEIAKDADADQSERVVEPRVRRHRRHGHGEERVAVMQDVVLKPGDRASEVVVVFGNATIDGDVDGDVVVVAGKANINGKVGGEVVLVLSSADLGPDAEINGQTTVIGGPLNADPGAKLLGGKHEVSIGAHLPNFDWIKKNFVHGVFLRPLPPRVGWVWVVALFFFAMHLFVALLLPRTVQVCSETLQARPVRSFFVGMLVFILFFPLLVLLLPTVIGAPLLLCSLIVSAILGRVALYRTTGGQVGRQLGIQLIEQPLAAFCAGAAIFYVAYMVPILGWIIWFVMMPLGVGAVILSAFGGFRREGQRIKPANGGPNQPPPPQPSSPQPGGPAPFTPQPPAPVTLNAMTSTASVSEPVPPPIPSAAALGAATAATFPPFMAASSQPGLSSAELASLPRVGFWPRLAASFLDILLLAIINACTFRSAQFFFLLMVGYHVAMWASKGTTLGGIVLALKVVRLDGRPLDWPVALVRAFSCLLSLAAFGLGFFWASWNDERQSWHDMIAGTTIVKLAKTAPLI